ncbi:MAG: hypothetical protein EOP07_18440 [Proteobacteria bacterium]|nr:MAG: hypothetical protein EOP07_18440 [Pseudomonadota bacterium]
MLKKSLIPLLIIAAASQSFTACKKSKRNKPSDVQYFIHGDPLSLVNGTETAPSFITLANIGEFSNYHFSGAASFIEREPVAAPQTWEEVEEENSTDAPDEETDEAFELTNYSFVQESATRYVYAPSGNARGYRLGFELRDGFLVLTDYDSYTVTAQHYSRSADGKAISFLVSYSHPSVGKLVTAFYFASSEVLNPIQEASKDFAFLYDTIKIKWQGPIKLEACGAMTAPQAESVRLSVNEWFADPNATGAPVPVSYSTRATHAPFSDLNQHCIFINLASKYLVDADVMLFVDHVKVASQVASGKKSAVLMHELGHFYGLGHEFKTDAAGKALHDSIMGYSQGTSLITDWDYEAVRDLYGQSLTLAP